MLAQEVPIEMKPVNPPDFFHQNSQEPKQLFWVRAKGYIGKTRILTPEPAFQEQLYHALLLVSSQGREELAGESRTTWEGQRQPFRHRVCMSGVLSTSAGYGAGLRNRLLQNKSASAPLKAQEWLPPPLPLPASCFRMAV